MRRRPAAPRARAAQLGRTGRSFRGVAGGLRGGDRDCGGHAGGRPRPGSNGPADACPRRGGRRGRRHLHVRGVCDARDRKLWNTACTVDDAGGARRRARAPRRSRHLGGPLEPLLESVGGGRSPDGA
eukprot:331883-Chlamydomonas_euryale.AAC.1